jgi:hypothetical protein
VTIQDDRERLAIEDARQITKEIEKDIKAMQAEEFSPINEYDIILSHIKKLLLRN